MKKIKQWLLALKGKLIAKLRRNNKKLGAKCTALEISKAMKWHKQEHKKRLIREIENAMEREGKL